MPNINAFKCRECEEIVEDLGPPVYECSRCSGVVATDESPARCSECNIFMRKEAETSCPQCDEGDCLEPITAWVGADKGLYESEAAEKTWIKDAPKREAAKKKNEEFLRKFTEEQAIKARAEIEWLLPMCDRLALHLAEHGASDTNLGSSLNYARGEMIRYPNNQCGVLLPIRLEELGQLFAPEVSPLLETLRDNGIPYSIRQDVGKKVREVVMKRIVEPPEFVERLDEIWFTVGGGPLVPVKFAAPGLLKAFDKMKKEG